MQSHPDVAPIGIRVLHKINQTTALQGTVRVTYRGEIAVLWDDGEYVVRDAQDILVYDVASDGRVRFVKILTCAPDAITTMFMI